MQLRPQQQAALDWLYHRSYGALLGDLGTGKTVILLSLMHALKLSGYGTALLVAPKRVRDNVWVQECSKFGYFDLTFSKEFESHADIHLVNPDSLHKVPDWMRYDTLVVDESTDFKSPSSKRFRRLASVAALFRRRYILTAGPAPNGYADLWAQYFLLDLGLRLGPNVTQFRGRYCQRSYSGHGYDVIPWAEPDIDRLISDISFRVDRSDLDIPERVDIDEWVNLSPDVLRKYKSLEGRLFAEIAGSLIMADSAAIAYAKCKQLTGGFLYGEDGTARWVHMEKIHCLASLHARYLYVPFLVVYQYDAEGVEIERRFNCPRISGATSDKRSTEVLDAWNAGEVPMLAAQIHTIAMGLNLQFGGNHLVVYSVPDNYNDYFQVVGRLHRPGVVGSVYVHHLVCGGTVDELKLRPRLGRKESKQKMLLRALKGYMRGTPKCAINA